jgi:hypothetical protein
MVISTIWSPPTSYPASSWISPLRLIPFVTMDVGHRPDKISPVPSSTFTASRSLYAGGFFAVAISGSSPLPWPSLLEDQLGSLFFPFPGGYFDAARFTLMLRAAVLLPFLRELQRFNIASHPATLVACYVATCLLPRPDLHRLANDDFQDTPSRSSGDCRLVALKAWLGLVTTPFCSNWKCSPKTRSSTR